MKQPSAPALLAACVLWAGIAQAGPGQVRGDGYTIHYNALSGDALPLVSTRTYGLRHSADQGLVTITVNAGGAGGANVPFDAGGHASTLLGKPVPLTFRHVNDIHGNHSVLVVFDVSGGETVRFDLDVTPQDAATTHLHFIHSYEP